MLKTQSLLSDTLELTRKAAMNVFSGTGGASYVSHEANAVFDNVSATATDRTNYTERKGDLQQFLQGSFQKITDEIGKLDDRNLNGLSRITALSSIAANAVNNAERAAKMKAPKDQISDFLSGQLEEAKKEGHYDQTIARLKEKLNTDGADHMIISLVHTMHPTIHHTPEARMFEAQLTEMLENPAHHMPHAHASDPIRLNQMGKEAVSKLLLAEDGFIHRLAKEETNITPKNPMSVSLETRAEENHFSKIREELDAVVTAWNASIDTLVQKNVIQQADQDALKISDARKEKLFELRTWGQSADADGREKSTSEFLYKSIQHNLAEKEGKTTYAGPTFDLRQNAAKVHRPLMSALLQVKLRNSEAGRYQKPENGGTSFADFCHNFMENPMRARKYEEKKDEYGQNWQGPRHSLFQQLDKDDRAAFVSEIIRKGYDLVPDQVRVDTLEYNDKMHPLRKAFLARYEDEIRAADLNPDTLEYKDMIRVTVPFDDNDKNGTQVSLRGKWDAEVQKQGFEILHNGLQYSRLLTGELTSSDQLMVKNFLQGTKKPGTDGFEDLTEQERATFTDTVKRLFVLNDAIDKFGPKVATRYQIANFSEPADFLIMLKLFEETGIAKIEKGVVKESKLGIMPLLETGEDLQNAEAIFSKLLADPVARSFWKARGDQADIMLGFSDGAASVGNFASQWEIYKASRDLTELFAKEGIKVRFLQGRGRGGDRGGTIDPSLQMDLMPPEVMQRGIYDVTLQSDLPMDLAASKSYGEDYFTKILIGTLGSSLNAEKAITPAQRGKQEAQIEEIANNSAEIYQDVVRNNPDALQLLNAFPANPNKTSRALARGGAKEYKVFDDVRAITKEEVENNMDLQAKNVGLNKALTAFEDKHGGQEWNTLKQHPFFKAVTKTIRAGIANYDPVIAEAQAKAVSTAKNKDVMENFVKKVSSELQGLGGKIDFITQDYGRQKLNGHHKAEHGEISLHVPSDANILDQVGHGIIVSSLSQGKTAKPNLNRPDQQQWGDTLFNALFSTTQEINHRQLSEPSRNGELARG